MCRCVNGEQDARKSSTEERERERRERVDVEERRERKDEGKRKSERRGDPGHSLACSPISKYWSSEKWLFICYCYSERVIRSLTFINQL